MARTKSLTPAIVLAITTTGCYDAVPSAVDSFETVGSEGVTSVVDPELRAAQVDAQLIEYGQSVEGRTLWLVRVSGQEPTTGLRPAALMMGVAQGIEDLGFLSEMPDIMRTGRLPASQTRASEDVTLDGARAFLDRGGVLYVVPVVNPDAREARTYENANGVNLNRDWSTQTQPETRALVEFLEREEVEAQIDLELVIDYHIGIPRLLYPRADSRVPIPFSDLSAHLMHHEMMPRTIRKAPISLFDSIRDIYAEQPMCEVLNDCVVSPRCHSGEYNCDCLHTTEWEGGRCIVEPRDEAQIERHGLSNDYFYDRFGAVAFVYEADLDVDYANVEDHALWWDASLGYIATGQHLVRENRFRAQDVSRFNANDLVRLPAGAERDPTE
ncbi:MAG: hypothetical protein ACJAYU_002975 [Bradymonadia bacterium]|jgi:hypothetical protein